jgi:hypothetical protein
MIRGRKLNHKHSLEDCIGKVIKENQCTQNKMDNIDGKDRRAGHEIASIATL